jgi:hypothetical protein
MAKSAIITLTTAGADTGPFNLLSDADSYVTPFETNVAKSSLITGYTSNLIPDAATVVRVQSTSGLCTNFINLTYPTTTTTSTTTTTTTTVATYVYLGRSTPDAINQTNACSTYASVRGYFSLKSSLASIVPGDIIYDSYPGTPTNGNGNWIALRAGGVGTGYAFIIDTNGEVTVAGGTCP